jgi:hypothetical protein
MNTYVSKAEVKAREVNAKPLKEKVKLVVGVVNVALIVIMLACIFKIGTGSGNKTKAVTVTSNVSGQEAASQAVEAEKAMNAASGTMVSVYYNLIQGTSATINSFPMSFEYGGKYNGFFDSANSNVKDYTYTVTELSDADVKENSRYVANLNIYNKDMSVSVQYKLIFDDNSNLLLYYPAAKLYIALTD